LKNKKTDKIQPVDKKEKKDKICPDKKTNIDHSSKLNDQTAKKLCFETHEILINYFTEEFKVSKNIFFFIELSNDIF
jgi:hypothetical protein